VRTNFLPPMHESAICPVGLMGIIDHQQPGISFLISRRLWETEFIFSDWLNGSGILF